MSFLSKVHRKLITYFDIPVVVTTFLICGVGLVILYSAGFNPKTGYSAQMNRQVITMAIGFSVFFFCMIFKRGFWQRSSYVFYAAGCVLLVLVFVNGVAAGGATRWLELGGFRMQPSEFMKLGVILALAKLFSSDRAPLKGYDFRTLPAPVLVLGIPFGLILIEPDLGTSLCVGLIGGSMLLVAGVKKKTLIQLGIMGLVMIPPAWMFLMEDYQKQRVHTFLSPESDPLGSGYHAIQSKIAVGSGMLTGKGFLEGTQSQLRFLPEQTTDFIFSVLAEEWGFVGSFFVLGLYAYLILRLIRLAGQTTDKFSGYVAVGVAALIFWQVVINIGMVIGVLPVVGLTLPLLSYGGSSFITIIAALGIASALVRRKSFYG
jgi:rod shape determining protein RodA